MGEEGLVIDLRSDTVTRPTKAMRCAHLDTSDQEIDAVVEAAAGLAAHSLEP